MQSLGMRAAAALMLIAPLLSDCASKQEDQCYSRTARPECPPGTPARIESDYRRDLANIDDERCRAAGEVGSAAYLKCRSDLHRERAPPDEGEPLLR